MRKNIINCEKNNSEYLFSMKQEKRYELKCVVLLMLTREKNNNTLEILLQKRKNTGYLDNMYDLIGGHLEKEETLKNAMIREAKEEIRNKYRRKKFEFGIYIRCIQKGIYLCYFHYR